MVLLPSSFLSSSNLVGYGSKGGTKPMVMSIKINLLLVEDSGMGADYSGRVSGK
jgi:hypothetical protein